AQLNSTCRNDWYNGLTASWPRVRDRRSPVEEFPAIIVRVPNPANPTQTTSLLAGAEYFSQGNELDQDVFEITNNLTIPLGDHRLTFGIHDEYFRFRNL